jgi:hypothetical protein
MIVLAAAVGCGEPSGGAAPAPDPGPRSARPEPLSPLGTNLASVRNYATGLAFTDVFKESSPFDDPDFADPEDEPGSNLAKDGNGWVKSFPGERYLTVLRRELDPDGGGRAHYPAGDYRFRWRGTGTFTIGNDARVVDLDAARREAVVRVAEPTTGGIRIEVTATDPKDYLREMSLVPVTAAGGRGDERFNPWFLESLAGFSVLRFMEWQGTNGSRERRFDDRIRPESQTQASDRGVALEHMIELANRLGVDAWFCIPHLADDDYVERFATLVRDRLDPGLAVYVEYSNEVWNGGFEQSAWASEQGKALRLGEPEGARFYARRSVEIFAIFARVFGGTDRLRRVLASQNANAWLSEQILDAEVPGVGPAHRAADLLAIAPYFDGLATNACEPDNQIAALEKLTTAELLARVREDVSRTLGRAAEHEKLAAARRNAEGRPLRLAAYEGGPHLVGTCGGENAAALTALLLDANRDPAMKALYLDYLAGWRERGGRLFVHYNSTGRFTKWGSWGFAEWYDQKDAPKLAALREFAAANPRWWRD